VALEERLDPLLLVRQIPADELAPLEEIAGAKELVPFDARPVEIQPEALDDLAGHHVDDEPDARAVHDGRHATPGEEARVEDLRERPSRNARGEDVPCVHALHGRDDHVLPGVVVECHVHARDEPTAEGREVGRGRDRERVRRGTRSGRGSLRACVCAEEESEEQRREE